MGGVSWWEEELGPALVPGQTRNQDSYNHRIKKVQEHGEEDQEKNHEKNQAKNQDRNQEKDPERTIAEKQLF